MQTLFLYWFFIFQHEEEKTDGDQNSASMFIIYNIVMNVIKTTI